MSFLCINCTIDNGDTWPLQKKLAAMMIKSFKKHHPGAKVIQMTDAKSEQIDGVDECQRIPITADDKLMDYRLKHIFTLPGNEVIVCDTDIIFKEDVWHVFSRPFDVAFTRRYHNIVVKGEDIVEKMPYNTGVMFIRSRSFFQDAYNWLMNDAKPLGEGRSHPREWWGDQLAIAEIASRGDYEIIELTCQEYNHTPESDRELLAEAAKVIHYKGSANKKVMLGLSI